MTEFERRRRPRIGGMTRSIRSKALVVHPGATVMLGAALLASGLESSRACAPATSAAYAVDGPPGVAPPPFSFEVVPLGVEV
jgi:hypothetical protein